uniref:Uncharacterized protein n=1 Tax=Fusarium lactis TaxID=48493 RepID=A0A6M4B060_9HYPO|nr:hypothetical protein [Fusarium lactis]
MEQGNLVALCLILKIITMKINLTTLLYYYQKFIYGLIYLSNKYFSTSNIFMTITILSYLLSSTLFIISIFNSLDVMYTSLETIHYLEELDLPLELVDSESRIGGAQARYHNNNIIFKFLDLFNANNGPAAQAKAAPYLPTLSEELRNPYYMQAMSKSVGYTIDEPILCEELRRDRMDNLSIIESTNPEGLGSNINYDRYSYKLAELKQIVLSDRIMKYEILNEYKSLSDELSLIVNNTYNN